MSHNSHSDSHNLKTESTSHSHTFRHMADKLFGHSHKDVSHTETNAHGNHLSEPVHHQKVVEPVHLHKEVVEPVHFQKEIVAPVHHHETVEQVRLTKELSNLSMDAVVEDGVPIVRRHTFEPVLESHIRPTLMEQTTRTEKIVEVQPIIHRMVTEPEVHIIEKHIYETVPVTGPHTVTKQAIVEETVKPRILEEIQPVVHRDIPAPFVERVEKHINEQISLAPTHSKEVLTERRELAIDEAVRGGLVAPVAPAMPIMKPVVRSHREAAVIETRVGATMVEETTRPEIITEIQPIIHREIDAPEVHIIEKHTRESVPMVGPHHITKTAIIEESIRPRIIEEIQPVIHREVPVAVVEHVEQHTTEELMVAVKNTKEVLTEKHVAAPVALLDERAIVAPVVPIVHSHKDAPALSMHTRNTIVEEIARPERIIEVQPIIHREVDAPEIHVVEKHLYEKVPTVGPLMITKQAIVEETVVPKVVEEVQSVLHREVPIAVVEKVEQHTTEHVVLATVNTHQSFDDNMVHTAAPMGVHTVDTHTHTHNKPGLLNLAKQEAGKIAHEVKFEAEKLKEEVREKKEEKKAEREEKKMEKKVGFELENQEMKKGREAL